MKLRRALPILLLLLALPAIAAPGFGCYVDRWQLAHPERWDAYCQHMKSVGMNTFAFFPKSDADLIDQMDTGVRTGLLDVNVPVVLISNMPARPGHGGSNEAEWCDLPARVREAEAKAQTRWPRILLYGTDEPSTVNQCVVWSCCYRGFGAKCITSVCVPEVRDMLQYMDGVLIHASPGVLTPDTFAAACDRGMLVGIYNIGLRKARPELLRYWRGQWSYQTQADMYLLWQYKELIADTDAGPVSSPQLQGYQQGAKDFAKLQTLKPDLGPPDWDFWPGIVGAKPQFGIVDQRAEWKADWIAHGQKCIMPPLPECLRGGG